MPISKLGVYYSVTSHVIWLENSCAWALKSPRSHRPPPLRAAANFDSSRPRQTASNICVGVKIKVAESLTILSARQARISKG